jgi:hypothetical protein
MATVKAKQIYVDTSVVLGMFDTDETRRQQTAVFWNAVQSREIAVIVSNVLLEELKDPSGQIRAFWNSLPDSQIKRVVSTAKSDALATQVYHLKSYRLICHSLDNLRILYRFYNARFNKKQDSFTIHAARL